MRKWITALALAAGLIGGTARAADHRDGPAAVADPTTDITDVYAWMSADGSKVYLVLNVLGGVNGTVPATKFSDKAIYAFHINTQAAFGAPHVAANEKLILCTFSADVVQKFQCWGPSGEWVTDGLNNAAGMTSASGKMKVFAGHRNDPFFFNIRGFRAVAAYANTMAPALVASFDTAGCPKGVDAMGSAMIVGTLASDGMGKAATDDFSSLGMNTPSLNGNVASIVVSIDKSLLTTNGAVLSIWASTNKPK